MACNFGWDWGPEPGDGRHLAPVALHRWDTARLATVRPLVTVDRRPRPRRGARRRRARRRAAGRCRVAAAIAGRRDRGRGRRRTSTARAARSTCPTPDLWWPRGLRRAAAATRSTWRCCPADTELDTWAAPGRLPHASTARHRRPTRDGTPFVLVVNGAPVFVRGANWIPDDCFPSRIDPRARYDRGIGQAAEANINLLRVWGGGIYESEDFYDVCDRAGCWSGRTSSSPAPPTPRRSRCAARSSAEAREAVTRLAPAPQPGAVERQQREHLGLRRLGLAGRAGRPHLGHRATTSTCCPGSSPSSTRRGRTAPGSP